MKKLLIITNSYKDRDLVVTGEIIKYGREKGMECSYVLTDIGEDIVIPDDYKDCDAILVLGGDGTFIHTAKQAVGHNIPVLGVNLGTLGYLCELEAGDIKNAIDQIAEGQFSIEPRMMLSGQIMCQDKTTSDIAINDVVIHRGGDLRVLNFIIYVNGEHLYTYTADGIIISTPMGSTGYSMSAGGPVVEPAANLIVVTPINPHIFNGRSIILSPKDQVEIVIGEGRRKEKEEALVTFDGGEPVHVYSNDRIVVTKAEGTAEIMRLNKKSFLKILSKKMQRYT